MEKQKQMHASKSLKGVSGQNHTKEIKAEMQCNERERGLGEGEAIRP